METFLECETMCREPPPGHVFVKVWRKSIQGKWQKWCVVHVTKKQRLCDTFFALSPKPIAQFRWKRARLSLFRPQLHLPSFIQIHPCFRDLLAKTTFQIVTIYGDQTGDRIADKKQNLLLQTVPTSEKREIFSKA